MLLGLEFIAVLLSCIHAQYQPPATRPPPYNPGPQPPPPPPPPYNPGPLPPPPPPPPPPPYNPGPQPPAPPGPYRGPATPPGPPSPDYPVQPPYVPNPLTNEYVQESIGNCADILDNMVKETRNKKNAKLYRKASKSLRKLFRFTFDRDTLRQLSGNVQRMNNANNRYKSKCRRSTSDIGNYSQLDGQFGDDNDNSGEWYSPKNSKRVARVQSIMDTSSNCIEDYCGY